MKKRFLALALGTLAFGVTLGGVKMGLGHQDALMVKAEVKETVYKSLSFPEDKNCLPKNNQYTETKIATKGADKYTIKGFSNNNLAWDNIRCGRKDNTSVASIATNFASEKAVSKVGVKIDAVLEDKVNSINLYGDSTQEFKNSVLIGSFNVATGEQIVSIPDSSAGGLL